MASSNQGRFQQQISFLRRQFLQGGGVPFADVLSEAIGTRSALSSSTRQPRCGKQFWRQLFAQFLAPLTIRPSKRTNKGRANNRGCG
ncbi:hypothetical protein Pr1d_16780 [Bythopirellula goksoeyrii]|uniref:Uncharacterized protein n=1 Tax=Bythopirellula goksoeyrii TaxID=1400387 RepID=A0A5B9QAB6_9BACT|nr:hypothetical protein Pr1d_16780 [Bythopirellula goksoeyrii]